MNSVASAFSAACCGELQGKVCPLRKFKTTELNFLGSFEIRHMATLIEYIKVGVRYPFLGKVCMPDRKEAILSPPDNESRNLYVIEILYDGVEDIRRARPGLSRRCGGPLRTVFAVPCEN